MLSKIREKATGIIAWAIVILITIPFALWGINSYFQGGGKAVVAEVEGVDIDLNTFQEALSERRRVMAQVLQQNVGADFFESEGFKRQVLEGLIQNAAESSYAQREGYRISDELLGQSIRTLPYFQSDGAFDAERYQTLVANAGMSVARFEQQQRQQLISRQIESAYADSAFVTERDIDRALSLLEQQRVADYAVLPANDPALENTVDDDAVRSYYEAHQLEFVAPEQIRVEYLVLSLDDIAKSIQIEEAEARQYYDSNPGRFGRPEQRRVSHILISVDPDADEATVEAARARAEDLASKARQGADFAELARENSDDSGSAAAGGDLGVITPGSMVKPFEDAASAMSRTGEVSEPVRSRFGFHVIKLTEYRPAATAPFDEVRGDIEAELKRQQAEGLYLERAETFATIVYEQPESLDPAAAELGLEIQRSDWFSAEQGEAMAANPRFRKAAFSDEVRIEGLNSEAFELDADTTVSLRRLETRERRQLALDEVSGDIRKILERQARADAVRSKGESLIDAVRSGTATWEATVADADLDAVRFEGTRDDASDPVSQQLVGELFSLPAPAGDSPTLGGMATPGGDFVIYRLLAVNDADPADVDEARRAAVRNILLTHQGEDLYLDFQRALREGADVTVFEDQL